MTPLELYYLCVQGGLPTAKNAANCTDDNYTRSINVGVPKAKQVQWEVYTEEYVLWLANFLHSRPQCEKIIELGSGSGQLARHIFSTPLGDSLKAKYICVDNQSWKIPFLVSTAVANVEETIKIANNCIFLCSWPPLDSIWSSMIFDRYIQSRQPAIFIGSKDRSGIHSLTDNFVCEKCPNQYHFTFDDAHQNTPSKTWILA